MYTLIDSKAGHRYYSESIDDFGHIFPGPGFEKIKGIVERQQAWSCKATGYKIIKHSGRRRSDR